MKGGFDALLQLVLMMGIGRDRHQRFTGEFGDDLRLKHRRRTRVTAKETLHWNLDNVPGLNRRPQEALQRLLRIGPATPAKRMADPATPGLPHDLLIQPGGVCVRLLARAFLVLILRRAKSLGDRKSTRLNSSH